MVSNFLLLDYKEREIQLLIGNNRFKAIINSSLYQRLNYLNTTILFLQTLFNNPFLSNTHLKTFMVRMDTRF